MIDLCFGDRWFFWCCVVVQCLTDEPCKDINIRRLSYIMAYVCLLEVLCCRATVLEPHEEFPKCGVCFFYSIVVEVH